MIGKNALLLSAALICGSLTIFPADVSAQRMIKVSPDGSTRDVTQGGETRGRGRRSRDNSEDGSGVNDGSGSGSGDTESVPHLTYYPTIDPTYTAAQINWAGRPWRVNSAATDHPDLPHSLQRSANWERLRFEVRESDPSMGSKPEKRRSELSGSIYGDDTRLPNGEVLWGAFSTLHHPWDDPEGMLSTYGAVFGQIHIGSEVGGSPALAFRRKKNGLFRITTRGELDDGGSVRYEQPLSWGVPHDIVYRVVLHPYNGSLRIWLDGVQIVNISEVSIGHSKADSYWNVGVYSPGGVTSPVIMELANHVYPGRTSLLTRTSQPPAWPND